MRPGSLRTPVLSPEKLVCQVAPRPLGRAARRLDIMATPREGGDSPLFSCSDRCLEPKKRTGRGGVSRVTGIRRRDSCEHGNQLGHLLVHAAIDLLVGPIDINDTPMLYQVFHDEGGEI